MKNGLQNTRCKKCNTLGKINVYPDINVEKFPKLKGKVRDYSLFQYQCPNCAHKSNLIYPCFYRNAKEGFLILFLPNGGQPEHFLTEELKANADFYLKRYCHTLEEFIEKVAIFEDGLEDRAIELLKLILFASVHKENESLISLYYYQKGERKTLEFTLLFEDGESEGIAIDYKKYEEIKSIVDYEMKPLQNKFYEINPEWAGGQLLP